MLHLLINPELKHDWKLWSETEKIEIGPFFTESGKSIPTIPLHSSVCKWGSFFWQCSKLIFINSFQSYLNQLLLMDFSQLTAVNAEAAVFNGRFLIQDVQLNTTLSFVMIIM